MDGVLVEKPIGLLELLVSIEVAFAIRRYLEDHPLGVVLGAAGLLEIGPTLVRRTDVSPISWGSPGSTLPAERVSVSSPTWRPRCYHRENIPVEMERELNDYLAARTRVVWTINPATRTAVVYRRDEASGIVKSVLSKGSAQNATSILPGGLSFPVAADLR